MKSRAEVSGALVADPVRRLEGRGKGRGRGLLTLLGAAAVAAGPSVRRVLGVPRGGAVPRPVEVVGLVLAEHADGLLLEAAVELPWGGARPGDTVSHFVMTQQSVVLQVSRDQGLGPRPTEQRFFFFNR